MTQTALNVLITGATGAIGQALAEEYAAPGVTLVLQGRRLDVLRDLAARCEARGARARTAALDLRDREALRAWLDALSDEAPPDLAIVNAGVNISAPRPGQGTGLSLFVVPAASGGIEVEAYRMQDGSQAGDLALRGLR
ncbi:MAG: SDR family NAD(P)-dependent oxidoreductase, partial [Achromobacter sp.]|uniref:SDR family NAD(P)-dependent oxidoreductase n=1 Tax=Achromobacter sp. TaxID=134375 RepID=UPI00258A2DEC